jgi:hypothetical protein
MKLGARALWPLLLAACGTTPAQPSSSGAPPAIEPPEPSNERTGRSKGDGSSEIEVGRNYACVRRGSAIDCFTVEAQRGEALTNGPVQRIALPPAIDLSVLGKGACAVVEDGGVWCWTDENAQPKEARGVRGMARFVGANPDRGCGITTDGELACWKGGERETVPAFSDVIDIAQGSGICLTTRAGGIACRGWVMGRAQGGDMKDFTALGEFPGLDGLAVADWHFCQVVEGRVTCRGENSGGMLGIDGDDSAEGVTPTGLEHRQIRQIHASYTRTIALDERGHTWWWGDPDPGAFVDGPDSGSKPVDITRTVGRLDAVATGVRFACGLQKERVTCWLDGGDLRNGIHEAKAVGVREISR